MKITSKRARPSPVPPEQGHQTFESYERVIIITDIDVVTDEELEALDRVFDEMRRQIDEMTRKKINLKD